MDSGLPPRLPSATEADGCVAEASATVYGAHRGSPPTSAVTEGGGQQRARPKAGMFQRKEAFYGNPSAGVPWSGGSTAAPGEPPPASSLASSACVPPPESPLQDESAGACAETASAGREVVVQAATTEAASDTPHVAVEECATGDELTAAGTVTGETPRTGSNRWRKTAKSIGSAATVARVWAKQALSIPKIDDPEDAMDFFSFTVLWGCLLFFTTGTNVMVMVVLYRGKAMREQLRDGNVFPPIVEILQSIWLVIQCILFVDIWSSYWQLGLQRACPCVRGWCLFRNARRPGDSGLIPPDSDYIGESELLKPCLWKLMERRFGVELKPRRFLLVLALLLPVNVLFFYRRIGKPFFTQPVMVGGDVADLLVRIDEMRLLHHTIEDLRASGNYTAYGSSYSVNLLTWEVFAMTGNLTHSPFFLSSQECYHPEDNEYALLGKLQGNDSAMQASCNSLLGELWVRWASWDDDLWDEVFGFLVRLFGAFSGIIADTMLGKEGGGFLEDMTDIFDMYMMSFVDVDQMHEGRPLLGSRSEVASSYHDWVPVFISTGYLAMFFRALAMFGYRPFMQLMIRMGHPAGQMGEAGKARLQHAVTAAMSLALIEVPFLSLRAMALFKYQVPVSVLAIKNVLHCYKELRILKLVRGFGEEQGHDIRKEGTNLCWCCRPRRQ